MEVTNYVTKDEFDKKIDELMLFMKQSFETLFDITRDIQRRVTNLEIRVGNIEETLESLVTAEEKDALASINHEHRIARLETRAGIHPEPPGHLSDLPSFS